MMLTESLNTEEKTMQITFDLYDDADVSLVTRLIGDRDARVQTAPSGAQIDPEASDPYNGQRPVSEVVEPTEPTEVVIDAKAGVELDANGTPWIEAVHATTKSKKADGTWTKKRGTDDAVLAAAEAEARNKITGTPTAPDMPPVEVETETLPPIEMAELVGLYSVKHEAGLITPEGFGALYAQYDTNPQDLGTNETARRQIYDHLDALTDTGPALPGMS